MIHGSDLGHVWKPNGLCEWCLGYPSSVEDPYVCTARRILAELEAAGRLRPLVEREKNIERTTYYGTGKMPLGHRGDWRTKKHAQRDS